MAGPGPTLPPRNDSKPARFAALEDGRIRLCDDLLVSINRSWQVEDGGQDRPVAAFKAMAPLAFWSPGEPATGDIFVAAVAPDDAYWLGFETRGGSYGVVPEINASEAAPHFLLVPDQPWFDAIRDKDSTFRQLVPDFERPEDNRIGAVIGLSAFKIPDDAFANQPDQDPDEVQPLYGQDGTTGSPSSREHPWSQRPLRPDFKAPKPCGRITVFLLRPADFQDLTGIALNEKDFSADGPPPEPFDPFQ